MKLTELIEKLKTIELIAGDHEACVVTWENYNIIAKPIEGITISYDTNKVIFREAIWIKKVEKENEKSTR